MSHNERIAKLEEAKYDLEYLVKVKDLEVSIKIIVVTKSTVNYFEWFILHGSSKPMHF